ncbi:MAG: hypothetical protein Q8R76_00470 [Candidatus Omnitrophota bacterium]|nr:hypothetical protein [Candidatus Omnitrophota bacterium]
MEKIIFNLGLIASFLLPLFNVPLIMKIIKRKSSGDLSLVWVIGVWSCLALMLPQALISTDFVFRIFGIMNMLLFSVVLIVVLKYRHKAEES